MAITEGVHELSERRGSLDLEEDFIVVVCDLDVQVLALTAVFGLLLDVGRTVVGHFGCDVTSILGGWAFGTGG